MDVTALPTTTLFQFVADITSSAAFLVLFVDVVVRTRLHRRNRHRHATEARRGRCVSIKTWFFLLTCVCLGCGSVTKAAIATPGFEAFWAGKGELQLWQEVAFFAGTPLVFGFGATGNTLTTWASYRAFSATIIARDERVQGTTRVRRIMSIVLSLLAAYYGVLVLALAIPDIFIGQGVREARHFASLCFAPYVGCSALYLVSITKYGGALYVRLGALGEQGREREVRRRLRGLLIAQMASFGIGNMPIVSNGLLALADEHDKFLWHLGRTYLCGTVLGVCLALYNVARALQKRFSRGKTSSRKARNDCDRHLRDGRSPGARTSVRTSNAASGALPSATTSATTSDVASSAPGGSPNAAPPGGPRVAPISSGTSSACAALDP